MAVFIGFLSLLRQYCPMSLASPQAGIVARDGAPDKPPADELYAKLTVAAAVFFVALEVSYLAIAGLPPIDKPWIDGTNYVLGRDFLNVWMGGRSAFFGGPAPWFDLQVYNQALRAILGAPYPLHYWSYPPHLILLIWPFGLLPYLPAYLAWCAIGIALYLLASSRAIPREQLVFLAVAPAIAICAFFGQNGFYTSALLIGGLVCLDRRPLLAGVFFGILTIKPQIGLLLPVMLLLQRRWLTIAAAVGTAAAMVVATSMLFGWNIWIEFWQKVVPQQQWLTMHDKDLMLAVVSSVYYGGRLVHLPQNVAWTLQAVTAAFAVAAVVWTYWKPRDPALSLALLVTATFLVTPYILNYDMVVFGFVVTLLRARADNSKNDHRFLIALWSLPATMMLAALLFVPLAPIVLIAFAARLLWRLRQSDGREMRPLPIVCAPAAA
jgi:alpha-1,2-mannosyltransferase